jgi:hypothetical protein
MAVAIGSKFACEGCAKSLLWKPEQAGKKVRCSCGTVMVVPQAPPSGAKSAKSGSLRPPPPIAQVAETPTLGYISDRPKLKEAKELPIDKLIDSVRDIYVPTALMAIGFLAMLLWALVGRGINAQMSMLVLAASCASTMIKTIIVVLACVIITAKYGEVSFGTFWTAVLKFSSIILINDAMLIWFEAWQIYRGAIEIRHGVMYIDVWLLVWELFMATFLIAVLLLYLFDMEKEQMFWMAFPIAFMSMAIGLGLRFAVAAAVNWYTKPPPPPPPAAAPAVVAPVTAPAPVPATKPSVPETPHDKAIRERIERGELKNVWEYPSHGGYQRSLFKKLYVAEVKVMYVEMRRFFPAKLYIVLSDDPVERAACFVAYRDYCEDGGITQDPLEAKDTGQRYLVIRLEK